MFAMAQSNISFGIRGGAVNAGMRGDAVQSFQNVLTFAGDAITTHNRSGFYGGGFVAIPLSENFSIEPGLSYTQKGYQLKGKLAIKGTELIGGKSQLNLSYVDVPLLAKANINGFQIFAGPQLSYLTAASLHTTAGAFGFNFFSDNRDVKDQFNNWDMTLTGGVGYQFRNGFNISAAYDYGISKINSGQNMEAYNQAVKVGMGFRF